MKQSAKIYVLNKDNDFSAIFLGTIEDVGDGFYIEYEDGDGVNCVIGYSKGIATVTRTSDPVYTVILEEEIPHAFDIVTPFGNIGAVAYPQTVRSRKNGKNRTLTLIYDLMIGKEKFRHELKLRVETDERPNA